MKLKEFESYQLLKEVGIPFPDYVLIKSKDDVKAFNGQKVVKVQTIEKKRAKSGGVRLVTYDKTLQFVKKFLNKPFRDEQVTEIILQDKLDIKKEFYIALTFDTSKRKPVLIFSDNGGIDVEEYDEKNIKKIYLNYIDELTDKDLAPFPDQIKQIFKKLYLCFTKLDCKMLEINPLIETKQNQYMAADASIVLDDNADFRRQIKFPERTGGRKATEREIAAREIDKNDYRGVAGKTYLDLDGDIGILTSGGGASMTIMDSLVKFGGKPANYTEYSGNPPPEKVEKLARIVMSKPNLSGLLVAGVIANFTNIAETMKGLIVALKEIRPKYPIVVRRAGPFAEQAREMLMQVKEELGLDIHYFDETIPLTKAAELMVDLSNKYKSKITDSVTKTKAQNKENKTKAKEKSKIKMQNSLK